MKFLILFFIILSSSCIRHQNDNSSSSLDTSSNNATYKRDKTQYFTNQNTVSVCTASSDTFNFSKEDYNDIINTYPELTSSNTLSPDSTFHSRIPIDSLNKPNQPEQYSFESEVGQDTYYILYAHFLKQKNGVAIYALQRKNINTIYQTINSLFASLSNGGSFFGHQVTRIDAYAEYSIYQYKNNQAFYNSQSNISISKANFINILKQSVEKEIQSDKSLSNREKAEKTQKMFTAITHLNNQITNKFYLEMAQSFLSKNYFLEYSMK